MKKSSIVIPHEHGGWAMVSVPFLFGMLAGKPQWMHILLFLAWLFLYLSSYPFLQYVKRNTRTEHWVKWGLLYGLLAVICLVPPLISNPFLFYFGLPLFILLLVNVWHAKRKSERAIINDLCAILIFSMGGAASYLFAGGEFDLTMSAIVLFSFLHFMGSAFFVKSVFRERENKRWTVYAHVYHGLLLFVPWITGFPWMTIAYIFSTVRAFVYAGKAMRPWKAGIIEIIGAVQFLILSSSFIS
ncbi:YwiC-like family protein [Brevibacillus laterosporus]|uniref:YwiC-like family protein n=1 Tax=Brevibacillus laterosporus TaxID=1465 RepID=UPI000B9C4184|nr:YwiC-like family protein [Brevibacillus laterosporus]